MLITLGVRYRSWTYLGIEMYHTASILIACEYHTSKVCLAYLQDIWTFWHTPDDWVTYPYTRVCWHVLVIHRVCSYTDICGHSRSKTTHMLLIGSIWYIYTQFCNLECFLCVWKIFYEFSYATLTFLSYAMVWQGHKQVPRYSQANQEKSGRLIKNSYPIEWFKFMKDG